MGKLRKLRKYTALFCAGIMTASLLAGCGKAGEDTVAAPEQEEVKKNTVVEEEEDTEKSMGRYLEKEMALPEEIIETVSYPVPYIKKLENGDLLLAEKTAGRYLSSDGGETWESDGNPWGEAVANLYVTDMAISPEGAVVMLGIPTGSGEGSEAGAEEGETAKVSDESSVVAEAGTGSETPKAGEASGNDDGAEKVGGASAAEATEENAESENGSDSEAKEAGGSSDSARKELDWQYYYYNADGNEEKLELPGIEIRHFAFDNENRLYGFSDDGKAYRIGPEEGSKKELFTTDGIMDFVCFTDRYMVGVTTRGGAVVYDTGEDILLDADEVLQEFIEQNLGLSIGSTDMGHCVVLTAGEKEDVIYFAFDGGLYRHVIGGTAIEQIIDGTTSTFGDPSVMLMDMMMLPDNEFLVLYMGMKLYRYTYDPNVPTVLEEQLKVYSLVENASLRQAISMFQKAHQDVYIRYEIGMSGDDGVTKEDAVRTLNTKIMSGEGPDILLLDGLPRVSYEEKGILADLSALTEEMTGDAALFPNIVDACREGGKIYALPVRVQLLMMAGAPEDLQKVRDMDSLAALMEEKRKEIPEGALLGVRTPEQLLYILSLSSSAAWTDEKENIDEKTLEEFLSAAKRIWQAEIAGVPEEELGVSESGYGSLENGYKQYYGNLSGGAENIAMEMQEFAVGRVQGVDFEYDMVTTLAEQEDNFDFAPWNGQEDNGFLPGGLAGISANSMDNALATEFYRYLFGKEFQDIDMSDGLPVNMASFEELRNNPRAGMIEGADERAAGSIGMGTPDGKYFGIELLWPTEEEFERLKSVMSSVNAVSTGDETIENTVFEIGARALEGTITPEEAVQQIVKKSAIYLAE